MKPGDIVIVDFTGVACLVISKTLLKLAQWANFSKARQGKPWTPQADDLLTSTVAISLLLAAAAEGRWSIPRRAQSQRWLGHDSVL